MVLRPPARTATATVLAVLAVGGLAACRAHSAAPRSAGTTPPAAAAARHRPSNAPGDATPSATASAPSSSPSAPPRPSVSPLPTSQAAGALPPVIGRIPVNDKVVFITIDDGWEKDADFVRLVQQRKIPLTLFLANMAIKKDYAYFRGLQQAGAVVEDHTMTHPYLPKLSYARQKQEICTAADIYAKQYGARPTLFRAPYGATNHTTLRAAKDCGIKAVFFWREVVSNGRIAYQLPGGLHPGDIVLVHFNPNMTADFKRMLHTIQKQGFRPAAVKDYLPATYFQQR